MQIVIDIPEEAYDFIKRTSYHTRSLYEAIKNGTPLPKGHGRLIDADALLRKHTEFDAYPFPSTTINNAPTIIEADKAESEGKE